MDSTPLTSDEYSHLIGLIYEGLIEPTPWQQSLNFIREKLGANYVTLIIRPSTPDDRGFMVNAGNTMTQAVMSYATTFYALDPFVGLPSDQVVTIQEILGETSWLESTFFQKFNVFNDTFHIMGADIHTPDGAECRLRVCRPRDAKPFSEEDKAFCRRLLPHLKRAVILRGHMGRTESERDLYAEAVDRLMIGTVILDENLKILQTNQVADELLRENDGLKISDNTLQATYSLDNQALQRLIKGALLFRSMKPSPSVIEAISVTRPSAKNSLGVVVHRAPFQERSEGKCRPAVVVFVRDPERKTSAPQEMLRQLFGFTPAEAALAMQLANGFSLEEAGETLNIRYNTVKAHLRAIFSKTGVTRQGELVHMLCTSVAFLGQK